MDVDSDQHRPLHLHRPQQQAPHHTDYGARTHRGRLDRNAGRVHPSPALLRCQGSSMADP